MDPKQTSAQLDPKLQEAYERVMGTISGTSAPTTASSQDPNPLPPPVSPMPTTNSAPSMPSTPTVNQDTTSTNNPLPDMPKTSPVPTEPSVSSSLPSTQPLTEPTLSAQPSMPAMPSEPLQTPTQPTPVIPPVDPLVPKPAESALPAQPVTLPTEPFAPTPAALEPDSKQEESMHATVTLGTPTTDHAIHGFVAPKKKTKISPVIIILGILAFIILYSLIWIKVFNLQLPFISQ